MGDSRRVFFALWPDAVTAARIDQAGKQLHALCGGRQVRRNMLHMTLLFLGNIPAERIDDLRQAAARVAGTAFTVRLDRWACWRHKQLAWAGCSEPPLHLLTLVGQLAERLAEEGLPLELRDFLAHVTLLRKSRSVPLPEFEPFNWTIDDFVLVESKLSPQGSHYSIIGRWPLTPDPD
ncbi:MAG: RNA 2',3'-cyclic phosphodiesterase [Sterolibacterium sp.]